MDMLTQQTDEIIHSLSKLSFGNYNDKFQSTEASCYACCRVFPAMNVEMMTEDDMTAICPNCMVDSVLFDCNNLPIKDADFLKQANEYWFTAIHHNKRTASDAYLKDAKENVKKHR